MKNALLGGNWIPDVLQCQSDVHFEIYLNLYIVCILVVLGRIFMHWIFWEVLILLPRDRKRLFSLINDLPTVFEVVTERKPVKDKPSGDSGSKSRGSTKVRWIEVDWCVFSFSFSCLVFLCWYGNFNCRDVFQKDKLLMSIYYKMMVCYFYKFIEVMKADEEGLKNESIVLYFWISTSYSVDWVRVRACVCPIRDYTCSFVCNLF